jgi:magnesium transporter
MLAMDRTVHRVSRKAGFQPGCVVYVGRERTEKVSLDVIDYDESHFEERRVSAVEECFPFRDTATVTWINVNGIHDPELVEQLGLHYGVHPLMLEDIVNSRQRPKFNEAADYILVVLKIIYADRKGGELIAEQVSVLFGLNWLITFQEPEGDVFGSVRERLRKTVPRGRFLSADYLAHALIDAVVDHYFVILEDIGDQIERLEDDIADHPRPESLGTIRELKMKLLVLRRAVWPLREVIGGLERTDSKLVRSTTMPYLRDVYEHTVNVIDTVEIYRDMIAGLLDLYHTAVSNRLNEIMKVLTVIATIFIPLGFLAGVYGMNFDPQAGPFNMPELGWPFGYVMFWGMALATAGGLLWFFRRRHWL